MLKEAQAKLLEVFMSEYRVRERALVLHLATVRVADSGPGQAC